MKEWLKNKNDFEEFDVRTLKGNFLQAIVFKAKQITKGNGLLIIQNFEPIPLYNTMKNLGFDYHTKKDAENNYYCYFFRENAIEKEDRELPLKPIVMPRYADIDPKMHGLSQIIKSVILSVIPIAIGTVGSVVNQFAEINILNINAMKSAIYLSGP